MSQLNRYNDLPSKNLELLLARKKKDIQNMERDTILRKQYSTLRKLREQCQHIEAILYARTHNYNLPF